MKKGLRYLLFVSMFLLIVFNLHAQRIKPNFISPDIGHISPNTGFVEFNSNLNSAATDIFRTYFKSFGLSNPDNMQLYRTDRDKLGLNHYRFRQQYKDIPIIGAEFIIHERFAKPYIGNGNIIPNFKIDINPAISSAAALSISLNDVSAEEYMWQDKKNEEFIKQATNNPLATFYPRPQLVIIGPNVFPNLTEYKLAYKTEIYASKPISLYTIFTDAQTGDILVKYDNMQYRNAPGKAITMYSDTVEIITDHFSGGFRLREDRNGVSIITLDANNKSGTATATDFIDTDNFWNNINDRVDQTATDAHWGTEMTHDYYKEVHKRNSIDDKGMNMLSLVHVGTNWYNASWNGVYMSYGDGNNNNPLTQIPIVGHELTHGVTQFTAGLIYAYESGALNESFSDIFGTTIGFWAGNTNPDGTMIWDIVFRNLADPKKTRDPDTYKGQYWVTGSGDNGGVHTNSQVQNHWYYILCEGKKGINDNEHEYDVKPIGIKKAEQIAYRTLSYYLTPGSQYFDARNASLQATEDLFGMCSEEYKQVANAWYAVGVGTQVLKKDVGISAVVSPSTSCEFLPKDEPLTLEIRYFGACSTLKSGTVIPIIFSVDGGDTLTENFNLKRSLEGGETINYTTRATFDFSKGGLYNINVWTKFPGDTNIVNDQKNINIYSGYNNAPSNDLAVSEIISPKTSCSDLGDAEVVEFVFLNRGCTPIPAGETIELSYKLDGEEVKENLILDAELSNNEKLTYQFKQTLDLSVPKIYDFEVSVNYSKDPVKSNNTLTEQIITGVLSDIPYLQDFEAGPGGWTSAALVHNNDWQWGIPSQKLIDTAASGKYAWMTNLKANHSNASQMVLVSPCFDFSNLPDPNICFDAIFTFEADFDGMILEYSTDNINWNRVEVPGYNSNIARTVNFGTPWFSRSNNKWTNYCAYVPQLGGEPLVRFRFKMGSDANKNDEGAAIDNFEIKPMTEYDLAVQSMDAPISSCNLSNDEKISVNIINYGSVSEVDFDISYSIDGGTWVSESVSDTLDYNKSYNYTFKQGADLSQSGKKYSIKVAVTMSADENPANNNKTFTVSNIEQRGISFTEDFEEGKLPEGWINSRTGNSKGWNFSDAETENARSGGKAWPIPEHTKFAVVNDISLNYNRRNDLLIMPPIDLTGTKNPALSFDLFYTDLLSSRATIEVSQDNGITWTAIDSCFPVASIWRQKIVSLADYAGESCLLFGVRFDDAGVKSTGIVIDNVKIAELPEKDCAVNGVYLNTGTFFADKENLVVELENKGTESFDNSILTVIYRAASKPPVKFSEPLGQIIAPGKTVFHTLNKQLDFSGTDDYYVTVIQNLSGDNNYANDTIQDIKIGTSATITKYPHKETFDKFKVGKPGTFINGWLNDGRYDLDWWVHKGSTPTPYTGPTRNHTSGNGNYLYVESSYPFFNRRADTYSPVFDVSSLKIPYLKFWYHMLSSNGAAGDVMGTLTVDVYDGQWHNDVWSISGNQGNAWKLAEVNLRDYKNMIKIRFRGETGPAQYSDIAIDDVEIFDKKKYSDIAITKLPKNGCGMTDGTDISIDITNTGTEHISDGIEISYSLDDAPFVKETYSGTLKSGEVLTHTFKNIVLPKGSHYFDFIISAKIDNDRANDTVYNHRVISYTEVFNYDEVTVCEGIWAIVSAANINGYDSFYWHHNSSIGRVLYADSAGMYIISFEFENGCTLTDSVYVNVLPAPSTGLEDIAIPEPMIIDAGDFNSYLWQDGSTDRTFKVTEDGLYYVTISDDNGCYGTDGFEVKIVSSVDDLQDNSLNVYPNPANETFNLIINNPGLSPVYVELIDIEGNVVYSNTFSGEHISRLIDVSTYPAGVYILKTISNGIVKIKKIIVY